MAERTIEQRYRDRVDQRASDGCWPWRGTRRRKGYGQLSVGGRSILAHRLAWELAHGPISEGLQVCHHCDNPPCCNPAHLFLGTAADNQHDKRRKGRAARGEGNPKAKLTEADVREIRRLLATLTKTEIARRFDVTRQQIGYIATGHRWAHLQ